MTNAGRTSPEEAGDADVHHRGHRLDDNSLLLLDADASRIAARAVRPDGSTIDEFEIAR